MTRAFLDASRNTEVKVIVLAGEGKAFCAGADLAYLQKLSEFDFAQNLDDSKKLMRLFHLIYTMRKPVIAEVNGAAIAGGCGLGDGVRYRHRVGRLDVRLLRSGYRFHPRDRNDFSGAEDRGGEGTRARADREEFSTRRKLGHWAS